MLVAELSIEIVHGGASAWLNMLCLRAFGWYLGGVWLCGWKLHLLFYNINSNINTCTAPFLAFVFCSQATAVLASHHGSFAALQMKAQHITWHMPLSPACNQKVHCAWWKPVVVKKEVKKWREREIIDCSLSNVSSCTGKLEASGPAERLSETKAIWSQVGSSWWPRCPV